MLCGWRALKLFKSGVTVLGCGIGFIAAARLPIPGDGARPGAGDAAVDHENAGAGVIVDDGREPTARVAAGASQPPSVTILF